MLFFPLLALATTPGTVPVHGALTAADGAPLQGTHVVSFSLTPAAGSAHAPWSDQLNVSFVDGQFVAVLGSGAALDLEIFAGDAGATLTVAVDGGPASSPVTLHDVPRAFWADTARTALSVGAIPAANVLSTSSSIPWSKLTFAEGDALPFSRVTVAAADRWPWAQISGIPASATRSDAEIQSLATAALTSGTTVLGSAMRLSSGNTQLCPSQASAGTIRWNGTNFEGCTPSGWLTLGGGGTANIVTFANGRRWSNGTYASSCNQYRFPGTGFAYDGATGDGVYTIDVDGAGPDTPVDVRCEMDLEGGGWTLVMKANMNVTGDVTSNGQNFRVNTDVNLSFLTDPDVDTVYSVGHLSADRTRALVGAGGRLMTYVKKHSDQTYKYCWNTYGSGLDANFGYNNNASGSPGVGSCGRLGWGYGNTCGATSTSCATYDAVYMMDDHWFHANGLNTGTMANNFNGTSVQIYCGDNATSGLSTGTAATGDRRGTCYAWAK